MIATLLLVGCSLMSLVRTDVLINNETDVMVWEGSVYIIAEYVDTFSVVVLWIILIGKK
jgi:hypothetical protein